MRTRLAAFILAAFTLVSSLTSQTSTDPNEGTIFTHDAEHERFILSWWGRSGKTYYIQHSTDLVNWSFVNTDIQQGAGAILEMNLQTDGARGFFRLFMTDDNAMPASWLTSYGLSATSAANDDPDGDGLTNAQEYVRSTNPNNADTDGDGASDGEEVAAGTNPFDNTSKPLSTTVLNDWEDGLAIEYSWKDYYFIYRPSPLGDVTAGALVTAESMAASDAGYRGDSDLRSWVRNAYQSGSYIGGFFDEYGYLHPYLIPNLEPIVPNTSSHHSTETNQEFEGAGSYRLELKGATHGSDGRPQVLTGSRRYLVKLEVHHKPIYDETFIPGYDETEGIGMFSMTLNADGTKTVEITQGSLPTGVLSSDQTSVYVKAAAPAQEGSMNVEVVPMEAAPDVLAVNADFTKGETHQVSGSTDGASENFRNSATLTASRASVDGSYEAGDLITGDLREGWFGIHPSEFPVATFDGATITIRKVDQMDMDTHDLETGQIRFHATWGNKQELTIAPYDIVQNMLHTPTPPVNLVGIAYGTSAQIPSGATLWMEGVIAGKITLEFRMQKGTADITYRQTFNVRNDWSKDRWQSVVRNELYVDSYSGGWSGSYLNGMSTPGVDIALYDANKEFTVNRPYLYSVYEYYAKLHEQKSDLFLWAGLAKLAGAPVYAGLSDAQNGRDATYLFTTTIGNIDPAVLKRLQFLLMDGNLRIYNDLAYQFVAYRTSGISALKYLKDQREITNPIYDAWSLIDNGYKNNSPTDIAAGNKVLLKFEQEEVLRDTYQNISEMYLGSVSWMFSILAENPIAGGPSFRTVVPSGNLAVFSDRWKWIEDSTQGMWLLWNAPLTNRKNLAAASLVSHATNYRWIPPLR